MKMKLEEIKIKEELYPRDKISQSKVREYEELIGILPPIIVNQDKTLIDGVHRYYAYKNKGQKEIEIELLETKEDSDLLLKAIELNSQHGLALTNKEKKRLVVTLYRGILDGTVNYDVKRLKKALSIPDQTFSDWTKKLSDELEAQRLEKILNLYLQCKTQQEIAEEIGLAEKTIYRKINEIKEKIAFFLENPNSEIGEKYSFLHENIEIFSNFTPKLYNVWNTKGMTNEFELFGNFPVEFMENLLYYYTNPFDIVYDPFAGGGVTIDACKKWFRKYYISDKSPIEIRKKEINQWKIQDGLPKDLPAPNFVFLDPPYWKQAEGKYSNDADDLANMPLDSFYNTIETFLKEIKKKMKEGYVALIIQNTQWKNNLVLEDHAFELYKRFEKLGFSLQQRIICPYATEQYNAQQVNIAKEKKICLVCYRDLLIFKR